MHKIVICNRGTTVMERVLGTRGKIDEKREREKVVRRTLSIYIIDMNGVTAKCFRVDIIGVHSYFY